MQTPIENLVEAAKNALVAWEESFNKTQCMSNLKQAVSDCEAWMKTQTNGEMLTLVKIDENNAKKLGACFFAYYDDENMQKVYWNAGKERYCLWGDPSEQPMAKPTAFYRLARPDEIKQTPSEPMVPLREAMLFRSAPSAFYESILIDWTNRGVAQWESRGPSAWVCADISVSECGGLSKLIAAIRSQIAAREQSDLITIGGGVKVKKGTTGLFGVNIPAGYIFKTATSLKDCVSDRLKDFYLTESEAEQRMRDDGFIKIGDGWAKVGQSVAYVPLDLSNIYDSNIITGTPDIYSRCFLSLPAAEAFIEKERIAAGWKKTADGVWLKPTDDGKHYKCWFIGSGATSGPVLDEHSMQLHESIYFADGIEAMKAWVNLHGKGGGK